MRNYCGFEFLCKTLRDGCCPQGGADGNCDEGSAETGDAAEARGAALWYPYRAGVPAVIDARTLHCAADNTSAEFRFVLWWIYNPEEP